MPQENQNKTRVLVVDDHAYFRESLVTFISEIPWVDVVGVAEDVIMPGENGIETAKRIKRDLPSTKIILYSMYDFDFRTGREIIAADRFIPKQHLFGDLVQAIRELCL